MRLSGVAKSTLAVIEAGGYVAPSGARRELADALAAAITGTRLYRPEDGAALLAASPAAPATPAAATRIAVTAETTTQAARRLIQDDGAARVAALNFASAKNPGGGFLGGAKAQEEDLARSSALYRCLLEARPYYDANRATASMLYTDHVIYSPGVPFFRDDRLELLEQPYVCSVITAPAPNAGEALRRDVGRAAISETLRRRAGLVLAIAEAERERDLVLGAWGCGVFRNDPVEVAAVFADWLASARFRAAFDRVTFAIYDRSAGQRTLAAFQHRFAC
jgi:uncharacterized protein (TIGR02452 family)